MTERLYYTGDTLKGMAQVLACEPAEAGNFAIILDKTLFHPQGGGQPADGGTINGEPVLAVTQRDDVVIHLTRAAVAPGLVELCVDTALRDSHSRWHSAGHLIGCAGELYGWKPVKAHHWPGEGRITFAPGETPTVPGVMAITEKLTHWIAQNLPRSIVFDAGHRQVRFGDLPAYGCGGTHVDALAAIGQVVITGVKVKKGQLVVQYQVD